MEVSEYFSYPDCDDNAVYKPELAIISAPTILLTLEAGVGNKTLPMLLMHIGFQSNVNDWSTKSVWFYIYLYIYLYKFKKANNFL